VRIGCLPFHPCVGTDEQALPVSAGKVGQREPYITTMSIDHEKRAQCPGHRLRPNAGNAEAKRNEFAVSV